jgi:ribosomal protein S18 acetylase RimI-like enzyme
MIFSIREARREDAHYVMDIDIKCFEYPWTAEFWGDASEFYKIVVGTYYGTPVGMAVYAVGSVICPTFCYEAPDNAFTILKVGVKKDFQRHGLGRLLVNDIKGIACAAKAEGVLSIVPESICLPDSDRDASGWLNKVGFEAKHIIPRCFTNCGESEDGFLFEWNNNAHQPPST